MQHSTEETKKSNPTHEKPRYKIKSKKWMMIQQLRRRVPSSSKILTNNSFIRNKNGIVGFILLTISKNARKVFTTVILSRC